MGIEEYEFVRVVGKGSFGKVYLVKHRRERKHFCLKVIKLDGMSDKERKSCTHEVSLMQKMQHPNIVGFKDSFFARGGKELCIVMTYCDGGDMEERVKRQGTKHFRETQVLHWFVQVALGLQFLHDRRVLHRDLKTQNLFLLGNGRLVLGDLGISKVLEKHNDFARTAIGTPYYMSPELFRNKPYNHKSDVWALGCILYELTTLKHAFDANSINGLASKITKGRFQPIPSIYSRELRMLVSSMLALNPANRPSLPEILQKKFIKRHVYYFLREILQRPTSKIGEGTMVFKAAALKVGDSPPKFPGVDLEGDSLESRQARNLKHQLEKLGMKDCVEFAIHTPEHEVTSPSFISKSAPKRPGKAFTPCVASKRPSNPSARPTSGSRNSREEVVKKQRKAAREQKEALIRERERKLAVENALEKLRRERELRLKERMNRAERRREQAKKEEEARRRKVQVRRDNAQRRAKERVRQYRQKIQPENTSQDEVLVDVPHAAIKASEVEAERRRVQELDAWADAWQAKEAQSRFPREKYPQPNTNPPRRRRTPEVSAAPKPSLQQTVESEEAADSAYEYAAEPSRGNIRRLEEERQSFHSGSFADSDEDTPLLVVQTNPHGMHPQAGPVLRSPTSFAVPSNPEVDQQQPPVAPPKSAWGEKATGFLNRDKEYVEGVDLLREADDSVIPSNSNGRSSKKGNMSVQQQLLVDSKAQRDTSNKMHAHERASNPSKVNEVTSPTREKLMNVSTDVVVDEDDASVSDSEMMPMAESDDDIDEREEELKAELAFAQSRCKELNQTLKKARAALGGVIATSTSTATDDKTLELANKVEEDDGDDFDDVETQDDENDDDEGDGPQQRNNGWMSSDDEAYTNPSSVAKTISIVRDTPDPLEVSSESMEMQSDSDFVSPIAETMGEDDSWPDFCLNSAQEKKQPNQATKPVHSPVLLGGRGLRGRIQELKQDCEQALGSKRFLEVYDILKALLEEKLGPDGPNHVKEKALETKLHAMLAPDHKVLYRNKVDNLIFMEETQS